jgi:amino acid transporter
MVIYAAGAIVILSVINILGIRQTKRTQNLLTVVKVLGLLAVIAAGLLSPHHGPAEQLTTATGDKAIPLALILVLFTFGGWNEMISRALIFGTVAVTVLYLLANGAFLNALGYAKMTASEAVAADSLAVTLPDIASRLISILICISALGAVNGLIFTGARISYALGTEHALFKSLGRWHGRLGTPISALLLQGIIGLMIILFAGSFLDTIFYTAPVVWLFFLATCISVWQLRKKEPQTPRPFKVPLFPLPTLVFGAACIFMLYSSVVYAISQKPIGFAIAAGCLLLGAIIYAASTHTLKTEV